MAVLILKISIFQISGHERGYFRDIFRHLQDPKNDFHLISTSFYVQRNMLSLTDQISKKTFFIDLVSNVQWWDQLFSTS